ncbi:hypothetical protein [Psychroserpens burtonensis]|uniref:hypothetical protein n=1 Tax=Psychroserpens burtonensis TaxID=49278 RepID=UPI0003F6C677|nr:hypothetical protein [Psychroserpens burtonensis]
MLVYLFLSVCFYGFSQKSPKPVYYYDGNGDQIAKEEYLNKSSRYKSLDDRYIALAFEKDTCFIALLKKRKTIGKLSALQMKNMFSHLNVDNSSSRPKFSIIQYHPGRDDCNNGNYKSIGIAYNIYHRGYLKELKTFFNHNMYWIHKKDETIKFHRVKYINWRLDKNQCIEKLFFEYHYGCNSFVIVNNLNGNYISILGESSGKTVIEMAKEINDL